MLEEITSFSVHPVSDFGSIQQLHISRVASSENYVTFQLSGGGVWWGGGCQDSYGSGSTVALKKLDDAIILLIDLGSYDNVKFPQH